MPELTVSVRELVAFCHRSGDIDQRFNASPTAEEGMRGHREIAALRGPDYLAEYSLEHVYHDGDLTLRLRGRADGYLPQERLVEEVKTCRMDPARIAVTTSQLHLAQARIYAALIAAREGLSAMTVRLTWYHVDERREYPLEQIYTAQELADFLATALAAYAAWQRGMVALAAERDASITGLAFPHREFRAGQREAAELVYRCTDRGGQLMLEAPTGVGKTAAVLFPALKALCADKHDRIVFCTAKNTGRRAAEETLSQLRANGLRATVLSLTAKERICFSPGKACRPDDCRFARGYYDKLPAARAAAVAMRELNQPAIEALARDHDLCPYQLGLDLLPWCDLVIADMHYVFSLTATLASLLQERQLRWTVLVDEAHNLPARARSMFSATLQLARFLRARRGLRGALRRRTDKVVAALQALEELPWQTATAHRLPGVPEPLADSLQQFTAWVSDLLGRQPGDVTSRPALQDAYFDALQFLRVAALLADDYACELQRDSAGEHLAVVLNCIDPARLLAQRHQMLHSLVVFSATLSPPHWMRNALGLAEDAVYRRCESPFSSAQLRVTIAGDIGTRRDEREQSRGQLTARIADWLRANPGNCMVYFSAYGYLRDCLPALASAVGEREIWAQPGAGDALPELPLAELLEARRDVLALCILGGVYSEGIDLPGGLLSSVVIVGPGLPQLDRDNRLQRDYFQRRYGDGFAYACVYPAMQRVNQALGRVVRSELDRGTALLIDDRYLQPAYRQLLAPGWEYTVAGAAVSRAG